MRIMANYVTLLAQVFVVLLYHIRYPTSIHCSATAVTSYTLRVFVQASGPHWISLLHIRKKYNKREAEVIQVIQILQLIITTAGGCSK